MMKWMRKALPVALVCLLMCSSCAVEGQDMASGESAEQEENTGHAVATELYSFYDVPGWVLDRDGNVVEEPYTVCYDALTGEPQFLTLTRWIAVGQTSETITTVLDLDGNILLEEQIGSFYGGVGHFAIRRRLQADSVDEWDSDRYTAQSDLVDLRTGEVYLPGVEYATPLGDGIHLALTGVNGRLLGVVDRDGEIVAGFPVSIDYDWAAGWYGYLVAYPPQPPGYSAQVLLAPDLTPVLELNGMNPWAQGIYGPYMVGPNAKGDGESVITANGQVLFEAGADNRVTYFDGELAVVYGSYDDGAGRYRLFAVDGTSLSEAYRGIDPALGIDEQGPAPYFIASKRDELILIGRQGEVMARKEIQNASYSAQYVGDGLCVISEHNTSWLLGPDLEVLVEPGIYSSIIGYVTWAGHRYYEALCAYKYENGVWLADILDMQGQVLVSNVTVLYDVGPDRLAVQRGFRIGLMDWQGNWITYRSRFTELMD